jgi:hypothetical protein
MAGSRAVPGEESGSGGEAGSGDRHSGEVQSVELHSDGAGTAGTRPAAGAAAIKGSKGVRDSAAGVMASADGECSVAAGMLPPGEGAATRGVTSAVASGLTSGADAYGGT